MKKIRILKKCLKLMASGKTNNRLMKYVTLTDLAKFKNRITITIEERAKEKYPCFPCHHECDNCIIPDVRQAYIAGATEQMQIDTEKGKTFIKDLLLSIIGCEPKEGWIENIQNEYEKIINE